VEYRLPSGAICGHCKKAIDIIRAYKTGIPMPRITSEMKLGRRILEKLGEKE
jgi:hypothetical protein